ncbi:MAG: 5-methyltetrahydropteroyltriglutamate--homocysteine methyltransferase [Alphaproteobacteria bacterium]
MALPLLPTTVVGSYVQPDWLVDRNNLKGRLPPRIRAKEIWRVPEEFLTAAQDDATVVAIRDMERAGVDIITDGEIRRESYSNRFATALGGIDIDNYGTALDRTGEANPVPRIAGPIRRDGPIEVRDVEFLRANTDRQIKITIPGPFTMTQQAQNDYYPDGEAAAMGYAEAVNEEIKALYAAGADIVQLDEPYMQARPDVARGYAIRAINRALEGVTRTTALHICFGYAHVVHEGKNDGYKFLTELEECVVDQVSIEAAQPKLDLSILDGLPSKTIMVGVIDMGDPNVETADMVAGRVRNALKHVPAERLIIAPDCGMKYLDRATAFGKLKAMVDGTKIVRREIAG